MLVGWSSTGVGMADRPVDDILADLLALEEVCVRVGLPRLHT